MINLIFLITTGFLSGYFFLSGLELSTSDSVKDLMQAAIYMLSSILISLLFLLSMREFII